MRTRTPHTEHVLSLQDCYCRLLILQVTEDWVASRPVRERPWLHFEGVEQGRNEKEKIETKSSLNMNRKVSIWLVSDFGQASVWFVHSLCFSSLPWKILKRFHLEFTFLWMGFLWKMCSLLLTQTPVCLLVLHSDLNFKIAQLGDSILNIFCLNSIRESVLGLNLSGPLPWP